ncbi:MAG: YARHG domain-containing protein [Clostridiales bacterium]|nr:YARHG domain-containing protein [Clostridiales bacterium]
MKKTVAVLLLLSLLFTCAFPALADQMYLIPDSNTRRLTEEELWEWDRESLGYIFNEIFARHGYVFIAGGKYDMWFRSQPWYTPNANPDNQKQVYPKLSQLEWDNYYTIKKVAGQMDDLGEKKHTPGRKCYADYTPPLSGLMLSGFSFVNLKADQTLPVYSAPSFDAWRGANGKAAVSTNGAVYAAGWESGWLLVFYETNNRSIRVGYVHPSSITGRVDCNTMLQFDYDESAVLGNVTLTDDPMLSNTAIRTLSQGDTVKYLTSMTNQNGQIWDYIETTAAGKPARGFIPHGFLQSLSPAEEF